MATNEDVLGPDAEWVTVLLPRWRLAQLVGGASVEAPTQASMAMPSGTVLEVGALRVDTARRTVEWRGTPIGCSQREIDLLATLCVGDRRARTFDELIQAAWKVRSGIATDVVHHAVKRLRRKLERHGVSVGIESVVGYGFRIRARDEEELSPPSA